MKLNKYIDHTLLKQDASQEQIDRLLSEAINLFSMAVPSVLSMLLIALASSLGIVYILLPLVLMLVLSFYLIIPMENLKMDSDSC